MAETTIVVRAFNEERHIGDLLRSVRDQTCQDYEIVLVDSGSTDKTVSIARDYCDKVLEIESRDFTFGYSLNVGCEQSEGRYIVIVSAHALPTSRDWLQKLVAPLDLSSDVAMVYGRHVGAQETKFSERQDFERGFGMAKLVKQAPDYYANNANSAIRKSLWEKHHFDEYITGLEDIAWAKYFMDLGYAVVYEPEAAVYHIHEETWHHIYNRYRREAIAAKRIGLTVPPHGRREVRHLCHSIVRDMTAALPGMSGAKLKEILRFRYYQWRGTYDGWRHDVDLGQEKYDLYYSGANRGVVISGKHHAALQELPMPDVKPGDVLIKVAYVGVCQTDLEIYEGELGYYKQGLASYPIVPGHEFSGEVLHVGANGGNFKVGDQVVGECILYCGTCVFCLAGVQVACTKRREVGVVNYNGGYARLISLPTKHVHRVPDGVELKKACLTEPLAVVRKAIRRISGNLKGRSDGCAIVGAGPIGNLCAQALVAMGHKVTVFDTNEARLEYLKGKAETSSKLDCLDGFNVVIEATGKVEALKMVLEQGRTDAALLLLGLPYGTFAYNFERIVAQDRIIVGSVGSSGEDFCWALQALPRIETAPFTEAIVPLGKFHQAWGLHRSAKHLKVIMEVD